MEHHSRVNWAMKINEKKQQMLRIQAWAAVIALALLFLWSAFPIQEFVVIYANY